jgi:hypothetical protein
MACSLREVEGQAIRNLVMWHVVVAVVLGWLYGVLASVYIGNTCPARWT